MRIEILEHRTLLAADFGDAPAPYTTLLAENGAQHTELGPILGATRDAEAEGVHSAAADGDGTDEDGVTFGTIQVGALDATLTVNVQGGSALLDAWIDFNGDGVWGGQGEQIFASQAVAEGDNALTFDVPSWANDGETFARFRLSSAGSLGPTGVAADGEVEDYALTLIPPAVSSAVFALQTTISTTADGARAVLAADLDGDGDMDVLSASLNDDKIAWHENDGNESFTEHIISTTAMGARSIVTDDVDGDGDLDVLSASSNDDKIAWYENDGTQNFTEHVISTAADGAGWVDVADIDGDGDQDVLSASYNDDKIAWYENNGNQSFTEHTISTAANFADSVTAGDLDRDGDLDVLSGSKRYTKLAWYENDGSQIFVTHSVSTTEPNNTVEGMAAVDLDDDGDLDFLTAKISPGSGEDDGVVAWFENIGDESNFPRHVILREEGDRELSTYAADIDGDGDFDVLASSGFAPKITLLVNDGDQNFSVRTVSNSVSYPYSAVAADIDGDGDLDVLSASQLDDKIAWYSNNALPVLVTNAGVTLAEGASIGIRNVELSATDSDNTVDALAYTVTTLPGHGQLELRTASGVAINSFTQGDIDAGLLLYRHEGSEGGDSFQFTVSDGQGGNLAGVTFSIAVNPINDAPVLDTALSPALRTTSEDAMQPASSLVSDLLAGAVTDPDPNARGGIAVTAASSYWGAWQISSNGGTTWQEMGAVSETAARLLPGWSRVRFTPKADFHGTVKLYYRAWDQTEGTVAGRFNLVGHTGGATAFSAAKENASLTVKPVNDSPKLSLGGTLGYVHDSPAITLAAGAWVTDVDSLNFYQGSLRVRITDRASSSNRLVIGSDFTIDANNNVLQGTTVIGQRTSDGVGRHELIFAFNTKATPAVVQHIVRAIMFKTVGGTAGKRTVLFSVVDGDRGVSEEMSKTVNLS